MSEKKCCIAFEEGVSASQGLNGTWAVFWRGREGVRITVDLGELEAKHVARALEAATPSVAVSDDGDGGQQVAGFTLADIPMTGLRSCSGSTKPPVADDTPPVCETCGGTGCIEDPRFVNRGAIIDMDCPTCKQPGCETCGRVLGTEGDHCDCTPEPAAEESLAGVVHELREHIQHLEDVVLLKLNELANPKPVGDVAVVDLVYTTTVYIGNDYHYSMPTPAMARDLVDAINEKARSV